MRQGDREQDWSEGMLLLMALRVIRQGDQGDREGRPYNTTSWPSIRVL